MICVAQEYPLAVGLPLPEIAPPCALAEVHLPRTMFEVVLVVALVLDPVPLVQFDILVVDLVLTLGDGALGVLRPLSVEDAAFEMSLIAQMVVTEVQLPEPFHLALMPLSNILLSVLVMIHPLSIPHLPSAFLLPSHRTQVPPVAHIPVGIAVSYSLFDCHHAAVGLFEGLAVVGRGQAHVLAPDAGSSAQEGLDEVDKLWLIEDLRQGLNHFLHFFLGLWLVQQRRIDLPSHHVQLFEPIAQRPETQPLRFISPQQSFHHIEQLMRVLITAQSQHLFNLVMVDHAIPIVVQFSGVAHCN